jgi:hypothetical protein
MSSADNLLLLNALKIFKRTGLEIAFKAFAFYLTLSDVGYAMASEQR